ncbi:hypothetical protein [Streptomyces cinereoruber]
MVTTRDKAGVVHWDDRPFSRSDVMDEWLAVVGADTFEGDVLHYGAANT